MTGEVSPKLMELMDHMELREKAMIYETPKERLASSLHEFDEEDITPFVGGSIMSAIGSSGGDPMTQLIMMLIIGLEIGRELERRAA